MNISIDAALRRTTEAESTESIRDEDRDEQYEAYEWTFRALKDVTPEDDERIAVVADWIVEQMASTGERPSSRAVCRHARQYCQENGFEISNNEWPGV